MEKRPFKSDKELEKLIDRLSSSSHSPKGSFSAEESFKKMEPLFTRKKQKRSIFLYISAAATVLLILGFSYMHYLTSQPAAIVVAQTLAETQQITLPDGTTVTLNHYSKLVYPETFKGDTREVNLSGEAYFEVTKNQDQPFIVQTNEIDVRVLGTHFNVTAYPQDTNIETTLLEGSVAVSTKNNSNRIILKPNESAVYNRISTQLTQVDASNAADDIAWLNGSLLFKSVTLEEIARKLSNKFSTRIEIPDSILQQYKLTARFTNNESLTEILDLLQEAANFTYEHTGKTIKLKTKN